MDLRELADSMVYDVFENIYDDFFSVKTFIYYKQLYQKNVNKQINTKINK